MRWQKNIPARPKPPTSATAQTKSAPPFDDAPFKSAIIKSPGIVAFAFQNGEELGYDKMSSGGMGDVRQNLAQLSGEDIKAIAEYVTSLK